MPVAIIVDWYGPISRATGVSCRYDTLEAARSFARTDGFSEALYMVAGKRRYQRFSNLQYVGVSNKISSRLNSGRLNEVQRDFSIWVREIASHGVSGKSKGRHSTAVNLAEWASAYFMQLHFNYQKRGSPPPESVILLNRWYKTVDFSAWAQRRGRPDWPDIIEYDGPGWGARKVFFGGRGRVKRYSPAEVGDLRREIRAR